MRGPLAHRRSIHGTSTGSKRAGAMQFVIIGIALAVLIAIIGVLARVFMREDKGKHGENINVINLRPAAAPDDTVQMTGLARRYAVAQQDQGLAAEHEMFL